MQFQELIATLHRYWGARGCVILQSHDAPVGAGTFHPATFLRSLDPGPWRCAYTQPSRRPADARYGENPNRLGMHTQYQVLLKPAPLDVQTLYLDSLRAIGIRLEQHDIRFVEDDWESPTLGAWGLGWEVRCDGMEVTQFTYFQQVGGIACRPVPVELTYGLERVAMYLQGVDDVYDLEWVDGVTYGDVFKRNEVEQSKYTFEHSDVESLLEQFRRQVDACRQLCDAGLALPAYDQCCASSHSFNLLDARGAISVAERARYIRRIRELACRCAEAWVAGIDRPAAPIVVAVPGLPAAAEPLASPVGPAEVFVEVLAEELAPGSIRPALAALAAAVAGLLEGIPHGSVRTWATPRRLAVAIAEVAPSSAVVERVVTGPPADRAFDTNGQPTAAGLGFARGRGCEATELFVMDSPKGRVAAVTVREGGARTLDRLSAGLEGVILGLPFAKSMEWGHGGTRFGRPIHRVTAVFGGQVVPGTVAGVTIDRRTLGHRLAAEPELVVHDAASWLEGLRARGVEPDLDAREATIRALLAAASQQAGADPIEDPGLVERVLHLTEAPALVVGAFEPELLDLPERLLVESMRTHTETFPLRVGGRLTAGFAAISNNPGEDPEVVAAGFARVLRARFYDARFFLAEDKKRPLGAHGERLARMQWIRGVGTMADKVARVTALASTIAPWAGADLPTAVAGAALCKADLGSQMVGEFPELQGHMGALYARIQGQPEGVAQVIEQHHRPIGGDGAVPDCAEAAVVALADRFDSIAGCFGIGLVPTGSGDPQGLRRAAAGIVRILVDRGIRMDLRDAFRFAAVGLEAQREREGFEAWRAAADPAGEVGIGRMVEFVLQRQRSLAGVSADVFDAVLSVAPPDPAAIAERVRALAAWTQVDGFEALLHTVKRASNIVRTLGAASDSDVVRSPWTEPAELALAAAVAGAEAAGPDRDPSDVLDGLSKLGPPVAAFFDAVLVDAADRGTKAARLDLLRRVVAIFRGFADLTRISSR